MLDTIYIEDIPGIRSHWLKRSEQFGLKSKCFESGEKFFYEVGENELPLPRVLVTDYDLGSGMTGSTIGFILRDDFNYKGPLIMSSSCTRDLDHFDLEIEKANILEVIENYFPKLGSVKEKFLSIPISEWTEEELAYAISKSWINIAEGLSFDRNWSLETCLNPSQWIKF